MSTNNNSPQSFLGGTWTRIEGRFLLGAGSGYNVNATGGEATHTLTKNEMPSHNHSMSYANANASYGGGSYLVAGSSRISVSSLVGTPMSNSSVTAVTISSTGSGDAHNNMPPYYVVYIRRRTA